MRQGPRQRHGLIQKPPWTFILVVGLVQHVVVGLAAVSDLQPIGEKHEPSEDRALVRAPEFDRHVILPPRVDLQREGDRATLERDGLARQQPPRRLTQPPADHVALFERHTVLVLRAGISEDDGVEGRGVREFGVAALRGGRPKHDQRQEHGKEEIPLRFRHKPRGRDMSTGDKELPVPHLLDDLGLKEKLNGCARMLGTAKRRPDRDSNGTMRRPHHRLLFQCVF